MDAAFLERPLERVEHVGAKTEPVILLLDAEPDDLGGLLIAECIDDETDHVLAEYPDEGGLPLERRGDQLDHILREVLGQRPREFQDRDLVGVLDLANPEWF